MHILQYAITISIVLIVVSAILSWRLIRTHLLCDIYKTRLEKLVKKSQLEQDIELATTEQLLKEVTRRVPGFILLLPLATNKDDTTLSIHIAGMNAQSAVNCMGAACHTITHMPPTKKYEEHDE